MCFRQNVEMLLTWIQGMTHLIEITEVLSNNYDHHTHLLNLAQNMTIEMLDTLEDTAVSAAAISIEFSKQSSAISWWPYIWCPAASLVMGSYGLPPSAMRNLVLVAMGMRLPYLCNSLHY